MDFSFTEEQQEIRSAIKKVLGELVTDESLKQLEKQEQWFHEKAWKALADAGMLALALPESVGGAGMGLLELCILLHQVGRTVAPIPAVETLASAALPIAKFGSDAQKQRFLPGVASGETILSAALAEYASRDAKSPAARAEADGDGYRLNGVFTNVGYFAQASRILVPARVGGGVGVFLLDPKAAGVRTSKQLGTNGEPLVELVLEGAKVAAEDVLAVGERGREALDYTVDVSTLAMVAKEYGVAEGALLLTANYSKERKQFGVPIGAFQGVSQRVGDAFIDTESIKVAMLQAAWLMDSGRAYASALDVAKFFAAEAGARVCAAAQHVHGGMGFDRDYPLHRYFLTSKHLEFTLGGAQSRLADLGRRIAAGTL